MWLLTNLIHPGFSFKGQLYFWLCLWGRAHFYWVHRLGFLFLCPWVYPRINLEYCLSSSHGLWLLALATLLLLSGSMQVAIPGTLRWCLAIQGEPFHPQKFSGTDGMCYLRTHLCHWFSQEPGGLSRLDLISWLLKLTEMYPARNYKFL